MQRLMSQVERNIQFFSQEYGSVEKVVEAYGFNDIEDLKTELFGIEKENSLIQKEQTSNHRKYRCYARRD